MRRMMTAVMAAFAAIMASQAYGTGFLMPDDARWGGLELESHRVEVQIEDQTARTSVTEVFRNQHGAQLEATFVFPLPKGASVSDFKMQVNGKLVTGEIVEARQARRTYEDIVRRMRDPGLLEYMDSNLIKLRVFPIMPGTKQEVHITYNETLPADEGLVEYVYPLKTPQGAAKTLGDFTMTVDIKSRAGVKNVYSPTHDVEIYQRDDEHATASFENERAKLDRDFQLFYEITDKEFGASLLSSKPRRGDGYFMLLVSPKVEADEKDIAAKDVVFVLDKSGSMQGEKIAQAKKALEFCVESLNAKDRFNILVFSARGEEYEKGLVEATRGNIRDAKEFIDDIKAGGGTNINEALTSALDMRTRDERPFVIVFMTDGQPTVGETAPEQILSNVKKANKAGTRIFPFGVGYDVNAKLLDELSRATKSYTQYVSPEEDIEVKVSRFFKRIGDPMLSDIKIDFGDARAYDVYPGNGEDLFRGGQLTIVGRYKTAGDTTLTVRGKGARGEEVFEYPVEFRGSEGKADFVANIWAGRKIAYLLGEIRLRGENRELRDEVVELSQEFGIVTPYTSYLVTETSPVVAGLPRGVRPMSAPPTVFFDYKGGNLNGGAGGVREDRMETRMSGARERQVSEAEILRLKSLGYVNQSASSFAGGAAHTPTPAGGTALHAAVEASRSYNDLIKDAKVDKGMMMRSVSGRTFVKVGDTWVDNSIKEKAKALKVKFGSDEYFELFGKAGGLAEAFGLGEKVIIGVGDWSLVIGEEQFGADEKGDYKAVLEALGKTK